MSAGPESRPAHGDYAPYWEPYVRGVPRGSLITLLRHQAELVASVLVRVDDRLAVQRYAPGKWSVKQVLGHVTDAERIFACRALRVARGDATPLPSFPEELYAASGGFEARTILAMGEEFAAVRAATVALLDGLSPEAWMRRGVVAGHGMTVLAQACVIHGHVAHHLEVLRERYGVGV